MVVHFSVDTEVQNISRGEQAQGKLAMQFVEEKLAHAVLEADKKTIEEGKLIADAYNQGIGAFVPSTIFQHLVKNYSLAKQLYGENIIRVITGYDPHYVEKNLGIPEFQRELKKRIEENVGALQDKGLLNEEGVIQQKGTELASLVLYTEELDHLIPKGILGSRAAKERSHYGEKTALKPYRKERYKDIAVRPSIRTAVRRGHSTIAQEDLKAHERQSKGTLSVVYALDASASMKGKKLETCKKAGIALAYKAIAEKDDVGLVVFGSDIKEAIAPTKDFGLLLQKITQIRASRQTDLAKMLHKAIELFPSRSGTKHLIILTDALPTAGKMPEQETLAAASAARTAGITISVIGIKLDKQGAALAERITRIGNGRLSVAHDLDQLDRLVVQDYHEASRIQ